MLLHGVAFLSWNQHPEPTGSRRATPLLHFQHSSGHPPLDVGSFHISLTGTKVANATFIGNVAPILTVVGGALFFP
jgi:hypothetical protein